MFLVHLITMLCRSLFHSSFDSPLDAAHLEKGCRCRSNFVINAHKFSSLSPPPAPFIANAAELKLIHVAASNMKCSWGWSLLHSTYSRMISSIKYGNSKPKAGWQVGFWGGEGETSQARKKKLICDCKTSSVSFASFSLRARKFLLKTTRRGGKNYHFDWKMWLNFYFAFSAFFWQPAGRKTCRVWNIYRFLRKIRKPWSFFTHLRWATKGNKKAEARGGVLRLEKS